MLESETIAGKFETLKNDAILCARSMAEGYTQKERDILSLALLNRINDP
jgi:3-deoxy-D-manno-octulosonic acid (KDO) 8-phosphate synthase